MARPRPPRLHMVSYSGPDPQIDLTNVDWHVLETSYGKAFDAAARQEIVAICNGHLFDQRSENTAEPQSLVLDYAEKARDAATPLWSVLCEGLGQGDAHVEYETQFEEFLKAFALRVPSEDIVVGKISDEGEGDFSRYDGPQLFLTPSLHLAREMVSHIVGALDKVRRGDGLIEGGFEQGRAYKSFLLRMRAWAKSRDWPITPFKGSGEAGEREAGPLSCLIYELTQRFPAELRTDVRNETAVAKRLKVALKEKRDAEKQSPDRP